MITASGTTESKLVQITLPENDIRWVLQIMRSRQDECRRVTPEFRGHEYARFVDVEIEKLKMKIANQL